MKVKELIEKLQAFDPESMVCITGDWHSEFIYEQAHHVGLIKDCHYYASPQSEYDDKSKGDFILISTQE